MVLKEQENAIKARKLEIECALYELEAEKLESKDLGTFNFESDQYLLKVTKKESTKVDQTMAEVVGLGFKKEYKFNKTMFNKLSLDDQKRVNECLTHTPAKPSFVVSLLEE